MLLLALFLGVYSYSIFLLGLLGLLHKSVLIADLLVFLTILIFVVQKKKQLKLLTSDFRELKKKGVLIFLLLFGLMVGINGVGALGPELGFDALWYHLTLPKLYLEAHRIFYIQGNFFYYSSMPKLIEMIYVALLAFFGQTGPKMAHFLFGIASCMVLYQISRKFFSVRASLVAVVLFYSNLVVGWQSITAYIDLGRTFFEVLALWVFIRWLENKNKKWIFLCGVMTGFAISSKLIAIGSVIIFTILIAWNSFTQEKSFQKGIKSGTNILVYWVSAIVVPFPWLLFSYVSTGNPVYPLFTKYYDVQFSMQLFQPFNVFKDFWLLFTRSSDPISPFYLMILPSLVMVWKKIDPRLKSIFAYCLIAYAVWYLTPRSGGGRFFMPYLPAYSILSVGILATLRKAKETKILYNVLMGFLILFSMVSIVYRGVANVKYLSVLAGKESKNQFLATHLNFNFGDFYDVDGYFKTSIKKTDKVLLYGFHNLYYVDFPFIHESYVKRGDTFSYIAVQNGELPGRFKDWNLVYRNSITRVALYSLGGKTWMY